MAERDVRKLTSKPVDVPTLRDPRNFATELERLMDMVAGESRPEALVARQAISILNNFGERKKTPRGEIYTVSMGSTEASIDGKEQELRLILLESENPNVEDIDDGAYLTVGDSDSRRFVKFVEDSNLGFGWLQILGAGLEWRDANPTLVKEIDLILDEIEDSSKKEYEIREVKKAEKRAQLAQRRTEEEIAQKQVLERKKQEKKERRQDRRDSRKKWLRKLPGPITGIFGIGALVTGITYCVRADFNISGPSQGDIALEFDTKNLVIDVDSTLQIGTSGNPVFAFELLGEEYADGKVPELEGGQLGHKGILYNFDLGGLTDAADIDNLRKIDLSPGITEEYFVRFENEKDTVKAITAYPILEEITVEVGPGYIRATWNPSDATKNSLEYNENTVVNIFVQRQPAPNQ